MPRFIQTFILLLTALTFAGCAAQGVASPDLPPPGFPISQSQGQSCGGFRVSTEAQCRSDQYCHRSIQDQCGAADAPGVCRDVPQFCTMDYNPVCGCDGQTYPNECAANASGISASASGECPKVR